MSVTPVKEIEIPFYGESIKKRRVSSEVAGTTLYARTWFRLGV